MQKKLHAKTFLQHWNLDRKGDNQSLLIQFYAASVALHKLPEYFLLFVYCKNKKKKEKEKEVREITAEISQTLMGAC